MNLFACISTNYYKNNKLCKPLDNMVIKHWMRDSSKLLNFVYVNSHFFHSFLISVLLILPLAGSCLPGNCLKKIIVSIIH